VSKTLVVSAAIVNLRCAPCSVLLTTCSVLLAPCSPLQQSTGLKTCSAQQLVRPQVTENVWEPEHATCLDPDKDEVDFMERDARITSFDYCELGNRERTQCEQACYAAGGSWTNPGSFCNYYITRCGLGDVTREFRSISYANVSRQAIRR